MTEFKEQYVSHGFIEDWYDLLGQADYDIDEEAIDSLHNFLERNSFNKQRLYNSALFQGQTKFELAVDSSLVEEIDGAYYYSLSPDIFGKWVGERESLNYDFKQSLVQDIEEIIRRSQFTKFDSKSLKEALAKNIPLDFSTHTFEKYEGLACIYNVLFNEFLNHRSSLAWEKDEEKFLEEGFDRLTAFTYGAAMASQYVKTLNNLGYRKARVSFDDFFYLLIETEKETDSSRDSFFHWGYSVEKKSGRIASIKDIKKTLSLSEETVDNVAKYVFAGASVFLEYSSTLIQIFDNLVNLDLSEEKNILSLHSFLKKLRPFPIKEFNLNNVEENYENSSFELYDRLKFIHDFLKDKDESFAKEFQMFYDGKLSTFIDYVVLRKNVLGDPQENYDRRAFEKPRLFSLWDRENDLIFSGSHNRLYLGIGLNSDGNDKIVGELQNAKSFLRQLKILGREHLRQIKNLSSRSIYQDLDELKANGLNESYELLFVRRIINSNKHYKKMITASVFSPYGSSSSSKQKEVIKMLFHHLDFGLNFSQLMLDWSTEDRKKYFSNPRMFKAFHQDFAKNYNPTSLGKEKAVKAIVSLEVPDIMTASLSGYSWRSCHANGYANSPVTLAANEVTFIIYIPGSKELRAGEFEIDSKIHRLYGHYVQSGDKDYVLSVERSYPSRNHKLKSAVMIALSERINEYMGIEKEEIIEFEDHFFSQTSLLESMAGNLITGYFDYLQNSSNSHFITKNLNKKINELSEEYYENYIVPRLHNVLGYPKEKSEGLNKFSQRRHRCAAFLHLYYQGYEPLEEETYMPIGPRELFLLSGEVTEQLNLGIESMSLISNPSPNLASGENAYRYADSYFDFNQYYECINEEEENYRYDYDEEEEHSSPEDVWRSRTWDDWFDFTMDEYILGAW